MNKTTRSYISKVWAMPGTTLIGGVKTNTSARFESKRDAENWVWQMLEIAGNNIGKQQTIASNRPPEIKANPTRRNSTSTEVRSPTSTETSTEAYTKDNVTVTGGAGAGATTKVTIVNRRNPRGAKKNPMSVKQMQDIGSAVTTGLPVPLSTLKEYRLYAPTAARNRAEGISKRWKAGEYFPTDTVKWLKEYYPLFIKNPSASAVEKNSTAADFRSHQKIRLQELAAMFQGEASGEKRRVAESDYTPSKKYRLGYLKLLKIKDGGKVIPITVNGDEKGVEAYVGADLRNNLLIVGKDARMESIKLPPNGNLRYLGELIQIDYVTAKKHIGGGKLIHFYHKLGEVTGEHPNLFVDHDGCLIIQGGGYDIWSVGVVN